MKVVDGHQSGWHSATAKAWRAALARAVKAGAKSFGVTECRLVIGLPGFDQYAPAIEGGPNAAECSILWDDDTYEPPTEKRWAWLTREEFRTGTGAVRPGVVATWALLPARHSDDELFRVVAHLPSSVQAGDSFSDKDARVDAWQEALTGLCDLVVKLQEKYEPTEVVVSCDWNVDLSRRSWRRRINRALTPAGLRLVVAERGTHGNRVIDAHATTMRVLWRTYAGRWARTVLRVFNVLKPLDHRGVLARLTSRRPARR